MMFTRNNLVAVIGVSYPGVENYLDDYFSSIENQSVQNFDLIIANDGVKDLNSYLGKRDLNCIFDDTNGSVAHNRRVLINKALKNGYEKIIFTDLDDTFENNRIEIMVNMLDEKPIVVNDLKTTDVDGHFIECNYLSNRFQDNQTISIDHIFHGNFLGLSNTAVRADIIKDSPALIHGESVAFDWYLWSTLLIKSNKAIFTNQTSTNYRIYDKNVAGLPQHINENIVLRGIHIKNQHYGLMSQLDTLFSSISEEFKILTDSVKNQQFFQQYLNALKQHAIDYHTWWENIRTPSEVGV